MNKWIILSLILLGGCSSNSNPKFVSCYDKQDPTTEGGLVFAGQVDGLIVSTVKDGTPYMTFTISEKSNSILFEGHWINVNKGQRVVINLEKNDCGVK